VRLESCGMSELVRGQPASPKATGFAIVARKATSAEFGFLGFTHIAGKSRPDGEFFGRRDANAAPRPMAWERRQPSQGHITDCGLWISRMKFHPFLSDFVPWWLGEWQDAQQSLKLRGDCSYFGVRVKCSAHLRSGTRFSEYG